MPYDSNGNFSLVPGTIVSDGMTIQPSQHNPPFQDVAAGMSQVVLRSGVAPMTGNLNMNGNKIGGLADATEPGDAISLAYIQNLAVSIGDGAWSVRDLAPDWLRRDGKLYLRSLYPDLADLLPSLPDSILWEGANSGTTSPINGMAQGLGKYVASGPTGLIITSTDRKNWTPRDSTVTNSLQRIFFGLGIFIIFGSNGVIVKSPDGDTWTDQTLISGGLMGDGVFDGTNFIVTGSLSDAPKVLLSTDANTWTTVTPPGTSRRAVVASNGSRAVIAGIGGQLATSDDHGETWTTRASGTTQGLAKGVWSEDLNLFIIVGAAGTIITSPDGIAWTTRASGTTAQLNYVAASSSGVVVGGNSGTVLISSNGTSYTSLVTGISENINAIVADEVVASHYIIGCNGGRIFDGIRTLPTQFRVPNDDPTYGWIRAL